MKSSDLSSRREIIAVVAFTLIGAGLRLWGFGDLGLNHFDEGVYALSGLWSITPQGLAGIDPMLIPYAPPGFPFLVGGAYLVLGVGDGSAILASLLCGVATIPVAAWLGRRTFGVGAGAATAALAAFSMPHAAFSRKALTDVPFDLTWLIAIGLGGRYLEKPTLGRGLALGVGVGLAQQFKYNGWLTAVVVALAAGLGLLRFAEERRLWFASGRTRFAPVGFSLLAAAIALLVYWPWYLFVERHGGYRSLIAHHQSYLGGFAQWYPFWKQQQAQVVALSGGVGWGAWTWSLAWLGFGWSRYGAATIARNRSISIRFLAGLVGGAAAFGILPSLPWWVGLSAVPWLLTARTPTARMLGSWWLILSVLTPFYHPYARLWIPLHTAGWLLVAGLIVQLGASSELAGEARFLDANEAGARRRLRPVLLVIAALVGLVQYETSTARPFPFKSFYQRTSGLRDVVASLPGLIPPASSEPAGLAVLGRRPLSFYLLLQGRYRFGLVEDRDDLVRQPDQWALLDGALFDQEGDPDLPAGASTRVVQRQVEILDPVTLLDVSPASATSSAARRSVAIQILEPSNASTQGAAHAGDSPP